MQYARHRQREFKVRRVELQTVLAYHLIAVAQGAALHARIPVSPLVIDTR